MRVIRLYVLAFILLAAALFLFLFGEPADVLKHVADVAGAIAPALTLLAVIAGVTGWSLSARFAGEESRRTEGEKRSAANQAHRGLVRARLKRVWAIVDEAVGIKPYQPDVVEDFVAQTEELYWRVDTFAAFSEAEHEKIRNVLDRCRLDNNLARRRLEQNPEDADLVKREYFLQSLDDLEVTFRDVFADQELANAIRHRAEWARQIIAVRREREQQLIERAMRDEEA